MTLFLLAALNAALAYASMRLAMEWARLQQGW